VTISQTDDGPEAILANLSNNTWGTVMVTSDTFSNAPAEWMRPDTVRPPSLVSPLLKLNFAHALNGFRLCGMLRPDCCGLWDVGQSLDANLGSCRLIFRLGSSLSLPPHR
jgi:hypothetical protein